MLNKIFGTEVVKYARKRISHLHAIAGCRCGLAQPAFLFFSSLAAATPEERQEAGALLVGALLGAPCGSIPQDLWKQHANLLTCSTNSSILV